MKPIIGMLALILFPAIAYAQTGPVVDPRTVTFAHADVDFALVASYRPDYYQCTSLTQVNNVWTCQGRAAAPFQAGIPVPKSAVTGTAAQRSFSLLSGAGQQGLQALPAGVGFVASLVAIADPAVGGTGSAASADSNPFYAKGKTPAAATAVAYTP